MGGDESYTEQEARLLARTQELRLLTQSLALDRRPYSRLEHVALREQLRDHRMELRQFRAVWRLKSHHLGVFPNGRGEGIAVRSRPLWPRTATF